MRRALHSVLTGFAAAALLAVLPCYSAAGDFTRDAVGTTAGQFLKLAVNARATAMGEAYSAMTDEASAMYWNPAGLIKVRRHSVVLMHSAYLADTSFDYASYARHLRNIGTFGVSVQYMNSGEMNETNVSGQKTGTFRPYDIAVSMGFAAYVIGLNKFPEERWTMGASVKIIRSHIVKDDSTIAADIGILTPYIFDESMQIAMVAQNLMGSLNYDVDDSPLPMTLRFGSRALVSKNLDVTFDAVAPRDNYPYLATGMEYRLNVARYLTLALRGGANTRAIFDYEGMRNVSMGFGISGGGLGVDYSYNPFGVLGGAHRLSATISF